MRGRSFLYQHSSRGLCVLCALGARSRLRPSQHWRGDTTIQNCLIYSQRSRGSRYSTIRGVFVYAVIHQPFTGRFLSPFDFLCQVPEFPTNFSEERNFSGFSEIIYKWRVVSPQWDVASIKLHDSVCRHWLNQTYTVCGPNLQRETHHRALLLLKQDTYHPRPHWGPTCPTRVYTGCYQRHTGFPGAVSSPQAGTHGIWCEPPALQAENRAWDLCHCGLTLHACTVKGRG